MRIKERLSRENRGRKVLIYAYPMQGGSKGHPSHASKHKTKTYHLGEAHFICHVLERYAAERGKTKVWSDSVHPTPDAQEYLRSFGVQHAREWTRNAKKTVPADDEDPLIIIIADGWNSTKKEYFEFRERF